MAKQKPKKIKKGSPPPIDKLLKPAIGIALALLGYQFFRGLGSEITRINVEDEMEIREVFFGEGGTGKNYVVLCNEEDSTVPISSVFSDAHRDASGSKMAEFRLIDCSRTLQSGKTIAERFKLDTKSRPTIFISGAVTGEPKQLPAKNLKTGAMLVKLLRQKLEPHAAKIETTQDLRVKCLDKDICGLLLKGTKKAPQYLKDAMYKLLREFPNVSFAAIDSSVLYVKNLEEFLPELENGQPRFVVFRKVSGGVEKGAKRLVTSIAALAENGVSYGPMSNLVGSVVTKSVDMQKIPVLPSVKTRTKKLEQEERAKRERRANRQQQKPVEEDTAAGRENDGTAQGRRAERERRRAEHRAQHNVKPKTPEEIAELERQRRIRMEEEAAKWNMAPEDLPPQGAPLLEEEEKLGNVFDEEDNIVVEDYKEQDEDDEDVLDLD